MGVSKEREHLSPGSVSWDNFRASATITAFDTIAQTDATYATPTRATPPLRNTPELTLAEARELEEDGFYLWRDGSWCEPTRLDLI